jgi:hypothetical protein
MKNVSQIVVIAVMVTFCLTAGVTTADSTGVAVANSWARRGESPLDKSGTTGAHENEAGSQVFFHKALTSLGSFQAERTGNH